MAYVLALAESRRFASVFALAAVCVPCRSLADLYPGYELRSCQTGMKRLRPSGGKSPHEGCPGRPLGPPREGARGPAPPAVLRAGLAAPGGVLGVPGGAGGAGGAVFLPPARPGGVVCPV